MPRFNHYRNEVFEPEAIFAVGPFHVVIQRKIYSVDTECLDIRRYGPWNERYKMPPIETAAGKLIAPSRKGIFLDMKTFESKVMPILRKLFPEKATK